MNELVDTFLTEAPLMLAELRSALADGNSDRFRRAAHSLKSNSNTFGATALGAMARELELTAADRVAAGDTHASRRAGGGISARRRCIEGALACVKAGQAAHGCSSSTTTRSIACCSRAISNCRDIRWLPPRTGASRWRCCTRERFDLVLLDMEMPEMNGFEVLERMVGDLQLRDLPVIVTSSLEGTGSVVRCIELGAEDYLPKPVNPVLLRRESTRASRRSACATSRRR